MTNQKPITTTQQLLHELIHNQQLSIKQIAKRCQLSESTLYLVLKGTRTLRPQSFSKIFYFYLAITVSK